MLRVSCNVDVEYCNQCTELETNSELTSCYSAATGNTDYPPKLQADPFPRQANPVERFRSSFEAHKRIKWDF